jgi:hypothetical protein
MIPGTYKTNKGWILNTLNFPAKKAFVFAPTISVLA